MASLKPPTDVPENTELRLAAGVAGVTRLELATSGVTGQRSNQLSYTPEQPVRETASK